MPLCIVQVHDYYISRRRRARSCKQHTTTNTTNNVSNALLGSLFLIVEFETTSVNPINETYIETSTVNNLTIIPPNATTTTTINATVTSNATVNILPNGLVLYQGQSLIVTEGDDGGTAEQENATTAFVDISRTNPDGTVVGTGVVFFSTNSTGQLAFLDNMVGISQSEFSSEGAPLESGNGRVERFHLRAVVVLLLLLLRGTRLPHQYARGRRRKRLGKRNPIILS